MADFGEAFGEGLLNLSDMMIKDSFEERAYARREAVQNEMWKERNAISNPQAIDLKDREIAGRKDAARIVAEAKVAGDTTKAAATVKAADKLAQSKLTLEDRKATAKVKASDRAAEKADRVPVMVESGLSDSVNAIKALQKQLGPVSPGGDNEDPAAATHVSNRITATKIHRDNLMRIERLFKAGKKEEADRALRDFLAKYGKKPETAVYK